jgi:hypothetical protein
VDAGGPTVRAVPVGIVAVAPALIVICDNPALIAVIVVFGAIPTLAATASPTSIPVVSVTITVVAL